MNIFHRSAALRIIAGGFVFLAACAPLQAQADAETIDGVVVKMGVISADANSRADFQAPIHTSHAMQRLIVELSYDGNHDRIDDAQVSVNVKSPKGSLQKKHLLHAAGAANYSELFRFDTNGQYLITVFVLRKGQSEPLEAIFAENVP